MSGRVIYSTDPARVCPGCGWPQRDCHCSSALRKPDEPVPNKITAKLRLEKRSSGKIVTVIDGLPDNSAFLVSLAAELKKRCGTGGTPVPCGLALQGDQRERLRDLLSKKGWTIKG